MAMITCETCKGKGKVKNNTLPPKPKKPMPEDEKPRPQARKQYPKQAPKK